ncbi:MAG: hypothetical protein PHX74_10150 [Candidatus Sumerlaeales bacterium]|nr:hypothetical protein [Candidatus Sumerlaeales bacterium]
MIYESTRKMSVKEQEAYDLGYLNGKEAALRSHVPDPATGLKGCWHCRNIEAHHIEYVIAVKAKGGTPMNTPVDCPYHYCPACGRKLEVGE